MKTIGLNLLLGVAVGDALGVPYEFSTRDKMKKSPAKDMIGYQTHQQPPGTWSDDSSLTFCLAETLVEGYDLKSLALKFIKWKNESYWTARNNVFDIGMTTSIAISRLEKILGKGNDQALFEQKFNAEEKDNGNGSLMRILPLILVLKGKNDHEKFELIWDNSALTHRHIRAAMSCFIYLKFAEKIVEGLEKQEAYQETRQEVQSFWKQVDFQEAERVHFSRIIQNDINNVAEETIMTGGYVIESLESSFWCILKTDSFERAVLKAVNFGHDTDTTAAITGGLAGLLYGSETIPNYWIASLARMEDIYDLGDKLDCKFNS
ncbi:ADP-ribosylglycohydrolase family protein [Flammeovirga sp. OC4]|uniref:ADP-ribosylglycohydrolase family protein n=1 Tax=Flammeovirga sp. OC4 TaxID=1382345 RepID=UPI0005C456E3|nr:ADP-ribosylglycohydrolase family protein [Flammeovirga sp. OC4]